MIKIGIIQNRPGIGDMCLFLPFIHFIANFFSTKIILFTKSRSKAKELLRCDPYIKKIIYTDHLFKKKNIINKISYVNKFKLNKVFIFSYGLRFPIIFNFSNTDKIYYYGIIKKNKNIYLDAKENLSKWLAVKNLKLDCKLFLSNNTIKKTKGRIVIGIGGSGSTKKWPIDNYINLIKKIKEKKKLSTFILAGGKDEKKESLLIKKKLSDFKILSLCDYPIDTAIKIISKSEYYIGNDTGFMHISGLLGLKTFGLFGDTPTNYASYNKKIKVIIPSGFKTITHNSRAINKITVSKVLKKVGLK